MKDVVYQLALADDYSATRAIEHVYDKLVMGLDDDKQTLLDKCAYEDICLAIPSCAARIEANTALPLDDAASIESARRLLFLLSQISGIETLVASSFNSWNDDEKKVGYTIKLGLVASLLLIVASTEFTYETENFTITKNEVSAEQIRAVSELIEAVIPEQSPEH